jgi:hypothetical protein
MRPQLAVLVVLFAAGFVTADSKPKPTAITPSEAGFTAIFPNEPREMYKDIATAAGNVTVVTYRVELKSIVYSVSFTDYPESFGEIDPEKILTGVRDGMKGDGSAKKDEKTHLDNIPGRDIVIEAGKNQIRSRVYLSKRRLYQVMVSGTTKIMADQAREKEIESFFSSFAWAK